MEEVQVKNYDAYSYEELSQISRDDHQEDVRQYDKQQNALCLVMIGAIALVCAILFFILSFERKQNQMAGLDALSLPFFVSIACFVAGATLLTVGLVRFFKAQKIRKALEVEIIKVMEIKTKMVANETKQEA